MMDQWQEQQDFERRVEGWGGEYPPKDSPEAKRRKTVPWGAFIVVLLAAGVLAASGSLIMTAGTDRQDDALFAAGLALVGAALLVLGWWGFKAWEFSDE